ncbi:hypothetical protein MD588_08600 [Photobacterium sp. SDRW27]|uniref:hypothetical protein n=1 Tax=Photobacterium obscurum TaxID=2829490 RepID=UPI0022448F6E|nr:hypothetical protein [Photobacterium obscurum]MCW8328867.1 hypothetical protein [Photobacterium obscurum]
MTTIEELKCMGVTFDDNNLKQCLRQYQIKQRYRELLDISKKLNLDLNSDIVKVSIATIVINYDDIIESGSLEIELMKTMSLRDPIFVKTIKKSNEFKELLYLVGDAVNRRACNK